MLTEVNLDEIGSVLKTFAQMPFTEDQGCRSRASGLLDFLKTISRIGCELLRKGQECVNNSSKHFQHLL